MISKEELAQEHKYLNKVVDTLEEQIQFLNNSLYDQERNLQETSEYMASSFYGSDAEEHAVAKQAMQELQFGIIALNETRNLKERQKQSPYFGRIDFMADDEKSVLPYYIGIAHIGTAERPLPYVLDWRAPLSSMYYDYELGSAKYNAPMGEITGKITLKRQYKTAGRDLVYAFDSSLTIGDDILKAELGKNASAKMKNIVATIQKEQNQIIRAPLHENMVVQGVAGSGKTSIALHRVAYLLYTNKIKASDILIVSPSGIFSDYISNVLPELGEANTPKITFEEIAETELFGFAKLEAKSQMLEDILAGNEVRAKDVSAKAGQQFFDNLKTYLNEKVVANFKAKDIKVGTTIVKAQEIERLYRENYQTKNPAVRVEWIADFVVDRLEVGAKNQKAVFQRVKKVLFAMFESTNIVDIYEEFLKTQAMTLNKTQTGKEIMVGYEDAPALLYIKNFLLGVDVKKAFKHIIIDEMQDYSLIALDLLNTIYPATKTILGDINQTLEKTLDKAYLKSLAQIFSANLYTLSTTYRSTIQIAKFSQKILGISGVKMINRSGEDVEKISAKNLVENLEKLSKKYESVAVITPGLKDAKTLQKALPENLGFMLVDDLTGQVGERKIVVPASLSKGLEFDAVVVIEPNKNLKIAKNIKYVSATRALHKLVMVEM